MFSCVLLTVCFYVVVFLYLGHAFTQEQQKVFIYNDDNEWIFELVIISLILLDRVGIL